MEMFDMKERQLIFPRCLVYIVTLSSVLLKFD